MTASTPDSRPIRRVAVGVSLILGPALIGLVRGTYPAFTAQSSSTTISSFAHHLGAARVELAAGLAATLVMPFFVLGVFRLTFRRAPVLATVGAVIAGLGWLMTSFMIASDALAYEVAKHGSSPALYGQFTKSAVITAGTTIFLVGHEVGTILLGAALWRARSVPPWAAIAFILGPIVHLLSVSASSRLLDSLAFAVLTMAGAVVARTVLRTPDDEWDLGTGDDVASALPARAAS